MSTHKHIDRICLAAVILSILLSIFFVNGEALGIRAAQRPVGYENRLFDTSRVHTIDIVMDDWDSFIQTAQNEEYSVCSVVIDGEAFKNVGIRGKGNTSLSTVASMDSDRYSFKIEFDQYDNTKTYHGLDKLSLNNLIQDNTMMKDYLTYQLMGRLGAPSPLCSYVYLTVNGKDWGLYLAVEAIEDSFLQRNYGSDYGELYKPDSMGFGGGRGNGKDFNMEDFMAENQGELNRPSMQAGQDSFTPPSFEGGTPNGFDPDTMPTMPTDTQTSQPLSENSRPSGGRGGEMPSGIGGGFGGGMGSSQTKLQYIDDDPDSYSTIFESAKTDLTDADKTRLIRSLKALSSGEDIPSVVAVDDVIRYFVVHNFVCNGDSYTGSMIHNYYLYEEDGLLSMLPWDYNLAFGTFHSSNATSTVNTPIDTPVSGTTGEDRPMIAWIFSDEEYTQLYHQYFREFLDQVDFAALIDDTAKRIAPYVEKDPSRFCTYEAFQTGVAAIREFCLLREQSVLGQLEGTIPSTTQAQSANSDTLVDASHLTISDMGTMGGNRAGGNFTPGENRVPAGDTLEAASPMREDGQLSLPLQSSSPSPQPGTGGGMGGRGGIQRPIQEIAHGDSTLTTQPQSPGLDSNRPTQSFRPGTPATPGASVSSQTQNQTLLLLGISILFLAAGLLIAFRFKR